MATNPARLVLRNGVVYSPAKPKATAVVIEQGVVRWIGGERALSSRLVDTDQVVDVEGAVVAPSFCDAHRKAFGVNDATNLMDRADGIGAAHVFPIIAGRGSTVDERMGRWLEAPVQPTARTAKRSRGIALLAEHTLTSIDAVRNHLHEAKEADVAAVFAISPATDLRMLIAGCRAWTKQFGQSPPVRLDGSVNASAAELRALAKLNVSIVFDGHRVDPAVAAAAARHGMTVAFGSFGSQLDPWMWLRRVVAGANSRRKKIKSPGMSAADGFTAVTSAGWRVAGIHDKTDLVVGAKIPLALWRVDGDSSLLPDLTNLDHLPKWIASVIDGHYA